MTKRFLLFFLFCFLFQQSFAADSGRPLLSSFAIADGDTVNIYDASQYSSLHTERLEDMKSMPMRKEDNELVNLMMENTGMRNKRNYPSLTNGLFIEVRTKQGGVRGMYVNDSRYTIITEDDHAMLSYQTYTIPKRMKTRINAMLSFYHDKMKGNGTMTKFDKYPMALRLNRNLCLFNPSRKTVAATFYVVADTLRVIPITYYITGRKKGVAVSRDIPLWERLRYAGTDENGTISVRNDFGTSWSVQEYSDECQADDILSELFPSWRQVSNRERMRMLDSCLESEFIQKKKK